MGGDSFCTLTYFYYDLDTAVHSLPELLTVLRTSCNAAIVSWYSILRPNGIRKFRSFLRIHGISTACWKHCNIALDLLYGERFELLEFIISLFYLLRVSFYSLSALFDERIYFLFGHS